MIKKDILTCCLVFLVAVMVYSLFGLQGKLYGDDSLMLYSGQKMADGQPPYVSTFYNLAPLGPMLMGLGVMAARFLGADDFLTVRLLFFIFGCLTVVSIYLLCRHLLGSIRAGLFGAFAFLGFYGFAERAASGPRDKTAMALFHTLGIYFLCRKNWFLAGLFTALAFLTWQPMGIYPVVALVLALTQPSPQRWSAFGRCLAGIALPMTAVLGYFMAHGALNDLIDGSVIFITSYFPMSNMTFFRQIITIFQGSGGTLPVFGLCMIIYLYLWRFSQNSSITKTLTRDKFAPLLISFPFPVFWSIFLDFRGYDDFFVFLPYVMVGFAKMLDLTINHIESFTPNLKPNRIARVMSVSFCLALIVIAALTVRFNRNSQLIEQKNAAAQIERRYGPDCKLLAIDVPQPLVFLHKTNPTRYVYAFFHFDRWIHDHTPGGFDGWLQQLDFYQPDVVIYGNNPCTYAHKIRSWLNANFQSEQIGPWLVYHKSNLNNNDSNL